MAVESSVGRGRTGQSTAHGMLILVRIICVRLQIGWKQLLIALEISMACTRENIGQPGTIGLRLDIMLHLHVFGRLTSPYQTKQILIVGPH